MNQTDLKHKLSAPFDFNEWKNILAQMFPKIDYLAKETSVDNNLVKNGGQIGVIHLNDGRSLGLFKFEVADNIHISRNRKGLREIAAKYVDQDIINGALVLYYSGIQTEYRLTFVSKQTVFDSEGNLSIKETAPKRYTFLLGESEPCTTAANRLIELINKNKRGSVYLDDVTEAFSVERLNKDFFNGYKTQYKRFVDTLTMKNSPYASGAPDPPCFPTTNLSHISCKASSYSFHAQCSAIKISLNSLLQSNSRLLYISTLHSCNLVANHACILASHCEPSEYDNNESICSENLWKFSVSVVEELRG